MCGLVWRWVPSERICICFSQVSGGGGHCDLRAILCLVFDQPGKINLGRKPPETWLVVVNSQRRICSLLKRHFFLLVSCKGKRIYKDEVINHLGPKFTPGIHQPWQGLWAGPPTAWLLRQNNQISKLLGSAKGHQTKPSERSIVSMKPILELKSILCLASPEHLN